MATEHRSARLGTSLSETKRQARRSGKRRGARVLALSVAALALPLALPAAAGAGHAYFTGASDDGSVVFFETDESLVPADSDDGHNDLYQRAGGVTALVSTNTAGDANGADHAYFRGASADGSKAFFVTEESMAASDADGGEVDVFERSAGATTQISTNTAGDANAADHHASFAGASDDGSKVFFETQESMAASDADGVGLDVFERSGGATTQVSTNTAGDANVADGAWFSGASADGSKVFFHTHESMAASDTDGAYEDVFERSGGVTKQVSTNSADNANGAHSADFMGVSDDGSKVFFATSESMAANAGGYDVYQRSAGATTQISIDTAGDDSSDYPAYFRGASADGSKVFFETRASMDASDADGGEVDVFERSAGATTQVSRNTTGSANGAYSASFTGASDDGSKVFFWTSESMAASDADGVRFDVFERSGGVTTQVSTNTAGNANGADVAYFSGASDDGSKVFFETTESASASDADGGIYRDVFERSGGATTQVSTNTAGNANGAHSADFMGASDDGLKVFFETSESMSANDADAVVDVYERSGGTTTLVSIGIPAPPVTPQVPATAPQVPATGQRAAALKRCQKKFPGKAKAKKRKKCKKKAKKLPV